MTPTVWPLDRVSLAALIDLGLSDPQIAAYFNVGIGDVERLRARFDFRRSFSAPRRMASGPVPRRSACLRHELDESLEAMKADIEVLRACNTPARLSGVIEETSRRLEEAAGLLDRLRHRIPQDSMGQRRQA